MNAGRSGDRSPFFMRVGDTRLPPKMGTGANLGASYVNWMLRPVFEQARVWCPNGRFLDGVVFD